MTITITFFYGLTFTIIAYLLWIRKPQWALATFVLIAALQLLLEGYRWQLIPFYGLLLLLLVLTFWQTSPQWAGNSILVFAFCGIAFSTGLHYLLPDFEFPQPTGNYTVGVTDHAWSSGVRAKIWYPANPAIHVEESGYLADFDRPLLGLPTIVYSHLKGRKIASYQDATPAGGHFPVIVYEYGADGHAEENTFLLTDLASHGYVVVAVDHSKTLAEYALDLVDLSTQPEQFLAAMREVVMPERFGDLMHVVNGLETFNQNHFLLAGMLDLAQINFLGYSLGGGIVSDYCATHSNCRAVVNLDGNPFISAHEMGINAPYLHLSQQIFLDLAKESGPTSTVAEMGVLYQWDVGEVITKTRNRGYPATWWLLNRSGHGSFTDLPYWIGVRWGMVQSLLGTVDTESSHSALRALILEFLQNPNEMEISKSFFRESFSDFLNWSKSTTDIEESTR